METADQTFFATISRFKSQDFSESSNQELLMMKSLIDEVDASDLVPLPNFEFRQSSFPSQAHFALHDQTNLATSPMNLYPFVSMYSNPQQQGIYGSNQVHFPATYQKQQQYFPTSFSTSQGRGATQVTSRSASTNRSVPSSRYYQQTQQSVEMVDKATTPMEVPSVSPATNTKRIKFAMDAVMDKSSTYPPMTMGAPAESQLLIHKKPSAEAKRARRDASAEEDVRTLPDSDSEVGMVNNPMDGPDGPQFTASIRGETRLNIKFISRGTIGEIPQKFGKGNCLIPDGISGTHQMYEQKWKFEIRHEMQNGQVLIRWTIHNLSSGKITSIMETVQDALNRESCGRTICNNVLRKALDARLEELEGELKQLEVTNPARATNMRNMIKHLRPARCTVGLLFFGLLHRSVQQDMAQQLAQKSYPVTI